MPKTNVDKEVVDLLWFIALYETADERIKRAVNYVLSLNEETINEIRRIANAKNKC